MKTYELMCVFSAKGSFYSEGVRSVGECLKGFGAVLEKEEDFGHRPLSYMLRREAHGHYHLYVFKASENIFDKLNGQLVLQIGLLRHLVILVVQKKRRRVRTRSASRPDSPRPDSSRPDSPRHDSSRPDSPRHDSSRADSFRPDFPLRIDSSGTDNEGDMGNDSSSEKT